MKTKTRTISKPRTSATRNFRYWRLVSGTQDGGTSLSEGPDNYSNDEITVESITYEQPFGRYYGNCIHNKTTWRTMPCDFNRTITFQGYPAGGADGWRVVEIQPYYLALWATTNAPLNQSVVVRQLDWKGCSSDAVESMRPTFSEKQESLVNFVLELRELGSLFKLWDRKMKFSKNMANAHLNYSFGWRPFLSDCNRIATALSSFRKKVRQLQAESGRPVTHHYRRVCDTIDLPVTAAMTGRSLGMSFGSATVNRIYSWRTKPTYCATMEYKYVLPDMSSLTNQAAAFLDHLGVQGNAAIIWNALPYSFVVDWFVNVSGWLNSLRTDNLEIPFEILGFCHSLKYEYEGKVNLDLKFQGFSPAKPVYFYGASPVSILVSYYERRRDIPSVNLFNPNSRNLSWSQILLGASLIRQRC